MSGSTSPTTKPRKNKRNKGATPTPATAAVRPATDAAERAAQLQGATPPAPYADGTTLIYTDNEGIERAVTVAGAPYGVGDPLYRIRPLDAPDTDMFAYHGELRAPRAGEVEGMQAVATASAEESDDDEDGEDDDSQDQDVLAVIAGTDREGRDVVGIVREASDDDEEAETDDDDEEIGDGLTAPYDSLQMQRDAAAAWLAEERDDLTQEIARQYVTLQSYVDIIDRADKLLKGVRQMLKEQRRDLKRYLKEHRPASM